VDPAPRHRPHRHTMSDLIRRQGRYQLKNVGNHEGSPKLVHALKGFRP